MDDAEVNDFMSRLSPESAGQIAPSQNNSGDEYSDFISKLSPESQSMLVGSPVTSPKPKGTMFQQATTPQAPQEKELTWGETASGAAHNLIPSVFGVGKSMASAVMHPIDTAEALGELGHGAWSQLKGGLGFEQDPEQKAKDEAVIKAIEDHYKDTYGSLSGFKKSVSEDPASVLMDVATLFSGGSGAATKLGALTGKAADIAGNVGKVASYLDPISGALKIAKAPIAGIQTKVGKVGALPTMRLAQSLSSGASPKALETAALAGSSDNPAIRNAFMAHMTGKAKPVDIVDAAQDALKKLSDERGETYLAQKKALTNGVLPSIPWNSVENALDKSMKEISLTDPNTGVTRVVNRDAAKALGEIGNEMNFYKSQPAGTFDSLEGFDALKRYIGDVRNDYKNSPVAYAKSTQMYNSVLDAIKAQHPDYAKMMRDYGDASDEINEIRKTFGMTGRSTDESMLRKILSSKTSDNKTSLLSQLSEKNPLLPYMIAGHELHTVLPGGLRQALNYTVVPFTGMTSLPMAGAYLAASSPRLMGALAYGTGKTGRALESATKRPITTSAYYAGRVAQEPNEPPHEPEHVASDMDSAKHAISSIESGGNYQASGPVILRNGKPDQAIGKYQVMASNIPAWTKKYYGKALTKEQFVNNPEAQEKVFEGQFGGYLNRFGNYDDAAAAWFSGRPLSESASDKDALGTSVNDYVGKFGQKMASKNGGRIERASGGRAEINHEEEADKIIRSLDKASAEHDRETKPLLNVPDEFIEKALSVANESV